MTDGPRGRDAGKPAGTRTFLSREIILDAAFRVVDSKDMNEITMSRLGRELDADPSAVYRHFRNKDELLLAMADVMVAESMSSYADGDDPIDNLSRLCWILRRSYLRRPGLARYVAARFTGGAAEAASVRHLLANMTRLGYDEDEAVIHTRAIAEMTLGHVLMTSDVLALPAKVQAFELEMARSYFTRPRTPEDEVDPAEMRTAHLDDGEHVFGVMLDLFLVGLAAGAPGRPTAPAVGSG